MSLLCDHVITPDNEVPVFWYQLLVYCHSIRSGRLDLDEGQGHLNYPIRLSYYPQLEGCVGGYRKSFPSSIATLLVLHFCTSDAILALADRKLIRSKNRLDDIRKYYAMYAYSSHLTIVIDYPFPVPVSIPR